MDLSALESSYDSLSFWLTIWTAIVVLGLILEYAHDFQKLVRGPRRWMILRKFIGGILVTAGVAGELFVQFRLSGVETNLRTAKNLQVVDLQRETNTARLEQEKLRAANLELEKLIAPRSLGEEKQFGEGLEQFAGTKVIVESLADIEASRLGGEIALTLNSFAKWEVVSNTRTWDDFNFFDGVTVERNLEYKDETGRFTWDDTGPATKALIAKLRERGLKTHRLPASDLPPHTIRVRVGLKPMPYFLTMSKEEREKMEEGEKRSEEAEKKVEELE